jgi:diguanylate cyclase (GGDEF)-like protein/PAS domain S-box-containing protein
MTKQPNRLLVVDDDEWNRDLMIRRLSKRGLDVFSASCGKDALKWIYSKGADLVILDVDMPEIDGFEVLTVLRKTYTPAQLPIIMATGKTASNDVVKALESGANDYVTKPIDFLVLTARIQAQLSRKQAEEALRKSEERYALAALGANDGLWDWDLTEEKAYFSPRWKSMLGWEENDISDDPAEWFQRIHPDDIDRVQMDIDAHIEGQTPHYEDEYRILHKDGNYLWMLGRGLAVRDKNGKAYRMAGSQTDITRGKVVDVLTGLPNRLLFMDRLARSFDRMRRNQDKTMALIFLDLDNFKLINDSLGHLLGDKLLVAIANRIESTVRSSDCVARIGRNHTVARLGGDEFIILMEDISAPVDIIRAAERISKALTQAFNVGGQELFPSASMGIALYNSSYQNPEDLLRDADTAMYRAKALGKGHFEVFDTSMRNLAIARLQLETELQHAVEREEFTAYYQPIISLAAGNIHGFEALIRWNHSARGLVLPGEFMSVAEETGLVIKIDQWVLATACQQILLWQSQFPVDPPMSINVNLSARNFFQPNVLEKYLKMLHMAEIPRNSLHLEVTESAMMPNPESAIETMLQLKALGTKIVMDDFGTGYSSLSYLHQFPLDIIKIDRSFVARIVEDDEIVRAIINLGRNLGLEVVAEGVETAEQVVKLRELGCEFAQGYFFSVPLNALEATDMCAAEYHRLIQPSVSDSVHKNSWPVNPRQGLHPADARY